MTSAAETHFSVLKAEETLLLQLKSNQKKASELWSRDLAATSGESQICHFDFSLATFNGTPFGVIFIFSSMHISALYYASTNALTCSHSQEFLVCVCVRTYGEAGLG